MFGKPEIIKSIVLGPLVSKSEISLGRFLV
jgi:hypothetical protein